MKPRPVVDTETLLWTRSSDGWLLQLQGDWRGRTQPLPLPPAPGDCVAVDARALAGWDLDAAPRL